MNFDISAFLEGYLQFVSWPLSILLLLTLLDFIFGIIVAFRKKEFDWAKLGNVALNNVLMVLVYAATALLAQVALQEGDGGILSQLGFLGVAAQGLGVVIGLSIGGSLLGHFAYLVPAFFNIVKPLGIKKTKEGV